MHLPNHGDNLKPLGYAPVVFPARAVRTLAVRVARSAAKVVHSVAATTALDGSPWQAATRAGDAGSLRGANIGQPHTAGTAASPCLKQMRRYVDM